MSKINNLSIEEAIDNIENKNDIEVDIENLSNKEVELISKEIIENSSCYDTEDLDENFGFDRLESFKEYRMKDITFQVKVFDEITEDMINDKYLYGNIDEEWSGVVLDDYLSKEEEVFLQNLEVNIENFEDVKTFVGVTEEFFVENEYKLDGIKKEELQEVFDDNKEEIIKDTANYIKENMDKSDFITESQKTEIRQYAIDNNYSELESDFYEERYNEVFDEKYFDNNKERVFNTWKNQKEVKGEVISNLNESLEREQESTGVEAKILKMKDIESLDKEIVQSVEVEIKNRIRLDFDSRFQGLNKYSKRFIEDHYEDSKNEYLNPLVKDLLEKDGVITFEVFDCIEYGTTEKGEKLVNDFIIQESKKPEKETKKMYDKYLKDVENETKITEKNNDLDDLDSMINDRKKDYSNKSSKQESKTPTYKEPTR